MERTLPHTGPRNAGSRRRRCTKGSQDSAKKRSLNECHHTLLVGVRRKSLHGKTEHAGLACWATDSCAADDDA
jgi:hypothetical protein